jgi:hypothetical protein
MHTLFRRAQGRREVQGWREVGHSRIVGARGWPRPQNQQAFRILTARWFWLVCGLVVGLCGTYVAVHARYQFRLISGSIASYSMQSGQLRLVDDATPYRFTPADFHPQLPRQIASGTPIVIWNLTGYPTIDALQIDNAHGAVGPRYTDDYFDHPETHLLEDRLFGGLLGFIGAIAFVTSLLAPLVLRRRRWLTARGPSR